MWFCLTDTFDYTLEEIAALVDSTVGGVKAALNRGRSKLAQLPAQLSQPRAWDPTKVHLYTVEDLVFALLQ